MMDVYVFYPNGATERLMEYPIPAKPQYDWFRKFLAPYFPRGEFEHVSVLFRGKRADMFVDELGRLKGLEFNEYATEVYHAATLAKYPKTDRARLAPIVGIAVLFEKQVWF